MKFIIEYCTKNGMRHYVVESINHKRAIKKFKKQTGYCAIDILSIYKINKGADDFGK